MNCGVLSVKRRSWEWMTDTFLVKEGAASEDEYRLPACSA
jgi:hypothetical protein